MLFKKWNILKLKMLKSKQITIKKIATIVAQLQKQIVSDNIEFTENMWEKKL